MAKYTEILIDVVLFLVENNLPFRGEESTLEHENCGLFLSTVKFISKYNTDLKHHLNSVIEKKVAGAKMQTHYMSWKSQNEFLKIVQISC